MTSHADWPLIKLLQDLRLGCVIALDRMETPGGYRTMKARIARADREIARLASASTPPANAPAYQPRPASLPLPGPSSSTGGGPEPRP